MNRVVESKNQITTDLERLLNQREVDHFKICLILIIFNNWTKERYSLISWTMLMKEGL